MTLITLTPDARTDHDDEGFTLIELLVVIIIIGILAAIAIPVFLNQRKKSVEASMKSDLRLVAHEMESYFATLSAYAAVTGSAATQSSKIGTGATAVTVRTSKGNVVTGTVTVSTGVKAGTYCLTATNSGVAGVTYRYDSDKGGLRAKNTACA